MKILYAIQGTGNGHVSRAREIIPHLKQYGDLDLLVSGTQAEVELEDEVKFRFKGFGFVFGQNGGVDFLETWRKFDTVQFIRDCRSLPIKDYDLVISDFEPVTSWACKFSSKKCVALSHQSAYLSPKTPQLKGFHWGRIIMNHYAPADAHVAFHFERYDDFINTPVIRSEIRILAPQDLGYYTVYLPAYSDEFILEHVNKYPDTRWEVFSKHSKKHYTQGNAEIFPIDNSQFQKSLSGCTGLLTGGGFEGPAEALYLGKKVLAVPMKNQYEQQCNALSLQNMGIPIIHHEHEFDNKLKNWLNTKEKPTVSFPNETAEIVRKLINRYGSGF